MTPEDRRYTRTHEWVKKDGEFYVVGITDHAQEQLGDITFVELPEADDEVEVEQECCVVESVKAASDLYSPLTGNICEVNMALSDRPELINEDPYEKGWIMKLTNVDESHYDALLDAVHYDRLIED